MIDDARAPRGGRLSRTALRLVPAGWRDSVARDLADEAARDGRRGLRAECWMAWHALRVAARFRRDARVRAQAGASESSAWNVGTDCRLAWRVLVRDPGSAVAVILTLALGTGSVTATYAVLNYALLRPVPGVVDEAGLVSVYPQPDPGTPNRTSITFAHLEAMRDQSPALTGLAAWNYADRAIAIDPAEPPRMASFVTVSRGFFEVLGVRPRLGRLFTFDEYESTGTNVLVISERFWRRAFGSDPAIVGRRVFLSGHPFEIIGVAGAYQGLDRLRHEDGWLADASEWTFDPSADRTPGRWSSTNMIGRLAPGATIDVAQAQLTAAFRSVGERRVGEATYWPFAFEGISDGIGLTRSRIAAVLRAMLAGVGLLLVLACANAANLMLARHHRRRSDLAIRHALGAARFRLVRELLVESSVLAVAAGVVGLGLAAALASLFRTSRLLSYLPVLDELSLDWRVVAFCAAASAATILVFALVPALVAARPDVGAAGPGSRATRRAGWLRSSLVGSQVALAFALVVAAALLAQTVHRLQSVDFGFDPDAVLQFSFRPSRAGYEDEAARAAVDRLQERIAGTAGVSRIAVAFSPLGSSSGGYFRGAEADEAAAVRIRVQEVTASYFDVLRIPVLAGRTFRPAEAASSSIATAPIVLSERLAQQLLGRAPATGRTILQQQRTGRRVVWQPRTVIGVVGNTLGRDVREGPELVAYEPFGRNARIATVFVRPDVPAADAIGRIRAAAREAAPGVPVDEVIPLRSEADEAIAQERVLSRLSLVIGAIAALLGLAGLYAATSQFVGERTREYAIRMAIGATKRDIGGTILGRVGRVTTAGLAVGAALAWPLTGLLTAYLFGVSRADVVTLAATAVALTGAALLAAWPAVRRAGKADPASALRTD